MNFLKSILIIVLAILVTPIRIVIKLAYLVWFEFQEAAEVLVEKFLTEN